MFSQNQPNQPNSPGISPFADPHNWFQSMMFGQEASNPNQHQNEQNLINQYGIDITGRYPAYNAARYLVGPEYGSLVNQYDFMQRLQPHEQEALMQMMQYLSHPELATQAYRDQSMANQMQQLPQFQQNLFAAGAGQGAQEGAALHAFNQANREGSSYAAQRFSPEGIAQSAAGVSNIFQMAQPNLDRLGQIQGIMTGTPREQSGLQAVGGIVGQAAGGGAFNNLFPRR